MSKTQTITVLDSFGLAVDAIANKCVDGAKVVKKIYDSHSIILKALSIVLLLTIAMFVVEMPVADASPATEAAQAAAENSSVASEPYTTIEKDDLNSAMDLLAFSRWARWDPTPSTSFDAGLLSGVSIDSSIGSTLYGLIVAVAGFILFATGWILSISLSLSINEGAALFANHMFAMLAQGLYTNTGNGKPVILTVVIVAIIFTIVAGLMKSKSMSVFGSGGSRSSMMFVSGGLNMTVILFVFTIVTFVQSIKLDQVANSNGSMAVQRQVQVQSQSNKRMLNEVAGSGNVNGTTTVTTTGTMNASDIFNADSQLSEQIVGTIDAYPFSAAWDIVKMQWAVTTIGSGIAELINQVSNGISSSFPAYKASGDCANYMEAMRDSFLNTDYITKRDDDGLSRFLVNFDRIFELVYFQPLGSGMTNEGAGWQDAWCRAAEIYENKPAYEQVYIMALGNEENGASLYPEVLAQITSGSASAGNLKWSYNQKSGKYLNSTIWTVATKEGTSPSTGANISSSTNVKCTMTISEDAFNAAKLNKTARAGNDKVIVFSAPDGIKDLSKTDIGSATTPEKIISILREKNPTAQFEIKSGAKAKQSWNIGNVPMADAQSLVNGNGMNIGIIAVDYGLGNTWNDGGWAQPYFSNSGHNIADINGLGDHLSYYTVSGQDSISAKCDITDPNLKTKKGIDGGNLSKELQTMENADGSKTEAYTSMGEGEPDTDIDRRAFAQKGALQFFGPFSTTSAQEAAVYFAASCGGDLSINKGWGNAFVANAVQWADGTTNNDIDGIDGIEDITGSMLQANLAQAWGGGGNPVGVRMSDEEIEAHAVKLVDGHCHDTAIGYFNREADYNKDVLEAKGKDGSSAGESYWAKAESFYSVDLMGFETYFNTADVGEDPYTTALVWGDYYGQPNAARFYYHEVSTKVLGFSVGAGNITTSKILLQRAEFVDNGAGATKNAYDFYLGFTGLGRGHSLGISAIVAVIATGIAAYYLVPMLVGYAICIGGLIIVWSFAPLILIANIVPAKILRRGLSAIAGLTVAGAILIAMYSTIMVVLYMLFNYSYGFIRTVTGLGAG